MTTIVGIKTNYGLDGIVLAADFLVGDYTDDGKLVDKGFCRKLQHGDYWVMGSSGLYNTRALNRFYGVLKGYKNYGSNEEKAKNIFREAIEKRRFMDVDTLNADLLTDDTLSEDTLEFILAIKEPNLNLWFVDHMGNLRPSPKDRDFDYLCAGSGSDSVISYIEGKIRDGLISADKINIPLAIELCRGSIASAERSKDAGLGCDLVVLTKTSLDDHGPEIRKRLKEAENGVFAKISSSYELAEKPQ